VDWLIDSFRLVARALACVGILAIIVLSVVPAADRPVTGSGAPVEHIAAFALVAGTFSLGYRLSLSRLVLFAFFFCSGVELLQVPLPTRHARVSDFFVDFVASCFAIVVVLVSENLIRRNDLVHQNKR
jgi:VanZ family protein